MNVSSLPVAAQPPEVTQRPTVGRIVHFYTSNKPPRSLRPVDRHGPFAAIVTDVNEETRSVTITVLPPAGEPFWVHGVRHKNDSARGSRFWEWPPR